jgi:ABC-type dipeptide/oligopeptide/nickel transport system permease subunit
MDDVPPAPARAPLAAPLVAGIALLVALVGFALLAPLFGDPYRISPDGLSRVGLPVDIGAAGHVLGTDSIGRDMLARVASGARTSLEIAFIANVTSVGVGALVGLLAGFHRGVIETVMMRVVDVFLAVPTVISGLALASIVGQGVIGIVVVVTAIYWAWTARVVYGEVLRLRRRTFVEAAIAQGVGSWTIVRRHLLPHLSSLLLVIAALNGAAVVAIGAGLSYLGAGIQPPHPEWGNMVYEGQDAIEYAPHLLLVPLGLIVLTVLAFVLIGDGLSRRGAVSLRRSWLDI